MAEPSRLGGPVDIAKVANHIYVGSIQGLKSADKFWATDEKVAMIIDASGGMDDLQSMLPENRRAIVIKRLLYPKSPTLIDPNIDQIKEDLDEIYNKNLAAIVVCVSGKNRAAVLVAAYLMLFRKSKLLSTISTLTDRMGHILPVASYRRDLQDFAAKRDLIEDECQWYKYLGSPESTSSSPNVWFDAAEILFAGDSHVANPISPRQSILSFDARRP